MAGDEHIRHGDEAERESEADVEAQRRFADLFDLRRIIGGLFAVYGLVLLVLGIGASDKDIDKAAGVNVNLWMGLAMLVVAAIFIAWALARPVGAQLVGDQQGDEPDESR